MLRNFELLYFRNLVKLRKDDIIKGMKTEIIRMDEGAIRKEDIQKAGSLIKQGELVAFPTETVYGLGADALNKDASRKIYAAKGRPSDNPLIVHISEFSALEKIVVSVPESARRLAEAFWPGPLTMCFYKKDIVPDETTGGLPTVGVRMPNHPVALEFIRGAGGYIAAPSANTSGRPSPTLASHVFEDMNGIIPLILDGGAVGIGIESTIVDFTGEGISILRPGFITKEMIEEVTGMPVQIDPAVNGTSPDAKPKAPGMKYRHYAPKAELTIIEGANQKAVMAYMAQLCKKALEEGKRCGIMVTQEQFKDFQELDGNPGFVMKNLGHEGDEASVAKTLYRVLREFDEEHVDVIYSEGFVQSGVGQAVMNRLIRAAGHRILFVPENG
ncbi:L-threonylcarbamoyladenylate synthase [Lachnospiraceae bacterium XBB1006]|nr:L-threonylcarbamoyladenylate synthase [Lachnospiraceae bacterium XBB1006]